MEDELKDELFRTRQVMRTLLSKYDKEELEEIVLEFPIGDLDTIVSSRIYSSSWDFNNTELE